MPLTARVGSASDTGLLRAANEDRMTSSATLCAVADGMGGHAAGEIASQQAIAELEQLATGAAIQVADLDRAIARANQRLLELGDQQRGYHGLGTTLTGIALVDVAGREHWAVFNVGDSRVYRFADATLQQLTVDHSVVQELLDTGRISADEARSHPRRNVVTRSLGTDPAPVADIEVYEPLPGERFLVCSDGLTNELIDAEIAQVLRAFPEPQHAADELVRRANQAGGRDNTTVIVLEAGIGEAPEAGRATAS